MLDLILPQRAITVSGDRGWSVAGLLGGRTRAGVNVDENNALTHPAVGLCTRIIVEAIGNMPIVCYERDADGHRKIAADAPTELLTLAPNEEMTAAPFRERLTMHQVNWDKGGFSEIVRDRRGNAVELWPIHPTRIRANVDPKNAGQFPYVVRNDDNVEIGMRRDEVLHCCGMMSEDGVWSRGVIANYRETIGGMIAVNRHGWAYWGSGAQPKGVFTTPGLKTIEDKRAFRKHWKEVHGSPDSAEIVIAPKDSGYVPFTVSNEDNQYLGTRQFNDKTAGQMYRVEVSFIDGTADRENTERRSVGLIMYTLNPWCVKQEQQYGMKLLRRDQWRTHFFEHDFSSLLRGDIQTRMNAYRVGLSTGLYSVNDICRLEGLPGVGPDGDKHYVPANMFTIEAMASGSTANGPHGPGSKGPGSDHSGAPGDSPLDHEPAMFDAWSRLRLTNIERDDLKRQLRTMQGQMDARKTDWAGAARAALSDTLKRMLTKESNAAARAAKSSDFEQWVRGWYAEHEIMLREDVLPAACHALRLAGVEEMGDPSNLAAWLRARNTEELVRCYNADSREVFARKLEAWPIERAKLLTDEIMRQASAPAKAEHQSDEDKKDERLNLTVNITNPPITNNVNVPAPVVNIKQDGTVIHVPAQEPPVVNVPAQDPPTVTVIVPTQEPPIVNVASATVNVSPTPVNVSPTPVTIQNNVPPAKVTVEQVPPVKREYTIKKHGDTYTGESTPVE